MLLMQPLKFMVVRIGSDDIVLVLHHGRCTFFGDHLFLPMIRFVS